MSTIYEPQGKAREYSPLSLNLYSGCDHGCEYCSVPGTMARFNKDYRHDKPHERMAIIEQLERDSKKFAGCKQVLLSFTTDPYLKMDFGPGLTRKALEIMLKNKIATAILTKGGSRCLRDLDLFKQFGKHIKVGATLVFDNDKDTAKAEPGAASYTDRIDTLKKLHDHGIRTWVSLEPVIIPAESLNIISRTCCFVDEYKVGKLNHIPIDLDWNRFLINSVTLLRELKKEFYIKNGLAKYSFSFKLTKEERDPDRLLVPSFEVKKNETSQLKFL